MLGMHSAFPGAKNNAYEHTTIKYKVKFEKNTNVDNLALKLIDSSLEHTASDFSKIFIFISKIDSFHPGK